MKFIKSILILIPLLLIGCSEIVNVDYADKLPQSQTARDPYTWTLLRFNGNINLLVDSVEVDIPNSTVTVWQGVIDTEFPLLKNSKIHILEPISSGYKMIQGTDTTGIDSMYIDGSVQKVSRWVNGNLNSTSFNDITALYKLYTVTY